MSARNKNELESVFLCVASFVPDMQGLKKLSLTCKLLHLEIIPNEMLKRGHSPAVANFRRNDESIAITLGSSASPEKDGGFGSNSVQPPFKPPDEASHSRNQNRIIVVNDERQQFASEEFVSAVNGSACGPMGLTPHSKRKQLVMKRSSLSPGSTGYRDHATADQEELRTRSLDSQGYQQATKLRKLKMKTKIHTHKKKKDKKKGGRGENARDLENKRNRLNLSKNMEPNQLRHYIQSYQAQRSALSSQARYMVVGVSRSRQESRNNEPDDSDENANLLNDKSKINVVTKQPMPKNNKRHFDSKVPDQSSKHFQLAYLDKPQQQIQIKLPENSAKEWVPVNQAKKRLFSTDTNESTFLDVSRQGTAALNRTQRNNKLRKSLAIPDSSALKSNLPEIKSPKEQKPNGFASIRKSYDTKFKGLRADLQTQQQQSRHLVADDLDSKFTKAYVPRVEVRTRKMSGQNGRDFSNTRGNQQQHQRHNVKPQQLGLTRNKFPKENLLYNKLYSQQMQKIAIIERRSKKNDSGTGFLHTTQRGATQSGVQCSQVSPISIDTKKYIVTSKLHSDSRDINTEQLSIGMANTEGTNEYAQPELSPKTKVAINHKRTNKAKGYGSNKTTILMSPDIPAIKSLTDNFVTFSNIETKRKLQGRAETSPSPEDRMQRTEGTPGPKFTEDMVLKISNSNQREKQETSIETGPNPTTNDTNEKNKAQSKKKTSELQRIFEQFKDAKPTHQNLLGSDVDRVTEPREHSSYHSGLQNEIGSINDSQAKLSRGPRILFKTGGPRNARRKQSEASNHVQRILKLQSKAHSPVSSQMIRLEHTEVTEPSVTEVSPIQGNYSISKQDSMDLRPVGIQKPSIRVKQPQVVATSIFNYEELLQPIATPTQISRLSQIQMMRDSNNSQQLVKVKQRGIGEPEKKMVSVIDQGEIQQAQLHKNTDVLMSKTPHHAANSQMPTPTTMDSNLQSKVKILSRNKTPQYVETSSTVNLEKAIEEVNEFSYLEQQMPTNVLSHRKKQKEKQGKQVLQTQFQLNIEDNSFGIKEKNNNEFLNQIEQNVTEGSIMHQQSVYALSGSSRFISEASVASFGLQNAQRLAMQRCMKHNFQQQRAELSKNKSKVVQDLNRFQKSFLSRGKYSILSQPSKQDNDLDRDSRFHKLASQSFEDSYDGAHDKTNVIIEMKLDEEQMRLHLSPNGNRDPGGSKGQSPRSFKQAIKHQRKKIRCSLPQTILKLTQEQSQRSRHVRDTRQFHGYSSKLSQNASNNNQDLINDMQNLSILENNTTRRSSHQSKVPEKGAPPNIAKIIGVSALSHQDVAPKRQSSSKLSSPGDLGSPLQKQSYENSIPGMKSKTAKYFTALDSTGLPCHPNGQRVSKPIEEINIKEPQHSQQSSMAGPLIDNSSVNSSHQKSPQLPLNTVAMTNDAINDRIKPPIAEEASAVEQSLSHTGKQKMEQRKRLARRENKLALSSQGGSGIDFGAQIDGWKNIRKCIVLERQQNSDKMAKELNMMISHTSSKEAMPMEPRGPSNRSQLYAAGDCKSQSEQLDSSTNRSAANTTPKVEDQAKLNSASNSSQKLRQIQLVGSGNSGAMSPATASYQFEFQPNTSRVRGARRQEQLLGEAIVYDEKQASILDAQEPTNYAAQDQFRTFEGSCYSDKTLRRKNYPKYTEGTLKEGETLRK